MVKRYYYDCPIEAAHMAKNFGMRFQDEEGDALSLGISNGSFTWYTNEGRLQYLDDMYVIHPDSLPILELRVGDGIGEDQGQVVIEERDGKPVFWPKEAASNA